MNHRGRLLLFSVQVKIARRNRESGILAHGRQHNNLGIESQISNHPFDNHRLLRILLAKESEVGTHGIEQNCNYRSDAAKVARPRLAFE